MRATYRRAKSVKNKIEEKKTTEKIFVKPHFIAIFLILHIDFIVNHTNHMIFKYFKGVLFGSYSVLFLPSYFLGAL